VSSSIGFLWLAVLVLWLSLQKPSFGQATYLGPPQSTHATSVAPVSNWSPLVPSALGGLITGFFAVVATWVTYRNNRKLNQAQHQRKINGLLGAIRNEVEIGYMVYRQKAGEQIEALPEGKPCMKRFELTQEYFIVYPNNTEIVGQTDDPELCKAIIDAYNMMNYTKDTLGVNNWYLDTLLDSKVQRSSHPFLNLGVSGRSKPATSGRIKTSHFEVR